MAAANTDKFIKGARRWSGQIGASGVADGSVTTIPLVSVTGLPTDTAVEITIDRVDANGNKTPTKEEVVRGVISGLNVINAVRGVEGTAQAHSAGAAVEVRLTADQWNGLIGALLVEHNQDGTHSIPSSIQRQGIINGGMVVNQRAATPSLSTSAQYVVDRMVGYAGGTVGAGTIGQIANANCGSSGYAMKFAGVTLTGSGTIIQRYRMEAKDAVQFKNQIASFAAKVYHDVGSAINYVITVRKPTTTADDFSAVTEISNSGNISAPSATATEIKFQNISLGDCSKGIEIEVKAVCGAVTTKNFEFAEFQFNKGAYALPFVCGTFEEELAKCQRYYEKSFGYDTAPAGGGGINQAGVNFSTFVSGSSFREYCVAFSVKKRIAPTVTLYSPYAGGGSGQIHREDLGGGNVANVSGGVACISEGSFRVSSIGNLLTSSAVMTFQWKAECEL